MAFIIWITRVSLPGMTRAAYSTRSFLFSLRLGVASLAASDSCARGSACPPTNSLARVFPTYQSVPFQGPPPKPGT